MVKTLELKKYIKRNSHIVNASINTIRDNDTTHQTAPVATIAIKNKKKQQNNETRNTLVFKRMPSIAHISAQFFFASVFIKKL